MKKNIQKPAVHRWSRQVGVLTKLSIVALLATSSNLSCAVAEPPAAYIQQQVASQRNKKRVLLVFAPTAKDARFQAQQKLWQGEQKNFPDYDLVEVPAFTSEAQPRALAKQYGIKDGEFTVLLIGKDGHVAYQTFKLTEAADLYDRINAMPMRRDEQRADHSH